MLQIQEFDERRYIERAEPITYRRQRSGKTHLLTGLAVAVRRRKRRIHFATAAALVNELVKAKHQLQPGRALGRWVPLRPNCD